MASKSVVGKAIEKLNAEIDKLTTARDVLVKVQDERPARSARKRSKKITVEMHAAASQPGK